MFELCNTGGLIWEYFYHCHCELAVESFIVSIRSNQLLTSQAVTRATRQMKFSSRIPAPALNVSSRRSVQSGFQGCFIIDCNRPFGYKLRNSITESALIYTPGHHIKSSTQSKVSSRRTDFAFWACLGPGKFNLSPNVESEFTQFTFHFSNTIYTLSQSLSRSPTVNFGHSP